MQTWYSSLFLLNNKDGDLGLCALVLREQPRTSSKLLFKSNMVSKGSVTISILSSEARLKELKFIITGVCVIFLSSLIGATMQDGGKRERRNDYILFFSLIINLDYTALILSIPKLFFLKYDYITSWTRCNNLLLKPRLSYPCNITSNPSSSLVFQSNLSFVLSTDNIGKCKLLLTVSKSLYQSSGISSKIFGNLTTELWSCMVKNLSKILLDEEDLLLSSWKKWINSWESERALAEIS